MENFLWLESENRSALGIWRTSYRTFKAKIPPEVDQPSKLNFYSWLFTIIEILANKSASLGICKKHVLIRMFSNGLRAWRASELLIKDLHFGEVPVRIYLPRSPPASKRRGVVLFHGGCGMYGSISKELKEKM
ncbi:hypothetical protein CIB84_005071 [Bambusicola thoracicus]|uniref:Alpha/beta hydrolase fold-3 domain-containing protein n=1 Tax=Bambusicola thoracicus TaxID=9083 RepID=A0A2P4T4A2_BAMTH|nr:hypothetical protein CIB84_005071 [Bambusicola thoracicus]